MVCLPWPAVVVLVTFIPFPQRKAEGSSKGQDTALIGRSSSFESRALYTQPGTQDSRPPMRLQGEESA